MIASAPARRIIIRVTICSFETTLAEMNILDYQPFKKPPRVLWRRRYRALVPVFAFSYCMLLLVVLIWAVCLADDPPNSTQKFAHFFAVVTFPMFAFYDRMGKGLFNFVVLGLANAPIWGVSVVALWHLSYAIIHRIGRSSH
jgi:hypothetical protein